MNAKLTRSTLVSFFLATAMMAASVAQASYVNEAEPNDSLATAQSLNPYFSTNFDSIITNSTSMAHASVNGTGDGTWDYYSFNLSAASDVIFDIDYGMFDVDSYIKIFNSSGTQINQNDDGGVNDAGTSHGYDSFLNTNLAAGLFYVAVGQCCASPLSIGDDYTLHVSASNPSAVPLPAAAPLMLSGLALMGGLARRRKQKADAAK